MAVLGRGSIVPTKLALQDVYNNLLTRFSSNQLQALLLMEAVASCVLSLECPSAKCVIVSITSSSQIMIHIHQ